MLVGFAWGTHLLLFFEASQNTVSACGSFILLTGGEREPALLLHGGCPESYVYSKLNMFWHSPSQTGRNSLPCIAPVVPRCLVLPAAAAGDRKGAVVTDGRPGDPVMSRGTQINSLALAVRAQITTKCSYFSSSVCAGGQLDSCCVTLVAVPPSPQSSASPDVSISWTCMFQWRVFSSAALLCLTSNLIWL